MRKLMWIVMGMVLVVAGCATGNGANPDMGKASHGFLGEHYAKLEPGPEDGAKLRWLKPGVDYAKYDKVMLDSVIFFFDDASQYKGIEPNELKELADNFNQQLVDALKAKYPVVAAPGPDVVRLRFAITDLKQSNPGIAGVTSVVPVGLAVSLVKKGATDSWSGSGATSAELMALDSQTNEVIAVAQDERTAGFTERFSKWGSADEAFKFWAERLVAFLDNARAAK